MSFNINHNRLITNIAIPNDLTTWELLYFYLSGHFLQKCTDGMLLSEDDFPGYAVVCGGGCDDGVFPRTDT